MDDIITKKESKDVYLDLSESNRGLFSKANTEDAICMLETVCEELVTNFESGLLNACYSTWKRYSEKNGTTDCTYSPRAFSLTYSDNDADFLPSYDTYRILDFLVKYISDEDITAEVATWIKKYLGTKCDFANPTDHLLDEFLEKIDESLINDHKKAYMVYAARMKAIDADNESVSLLSVARAEAAAIISDAKEKRDEIIAKANEIEKQSCRRRDEGEQLAGELYTAAEKVQRRHKDEAQALLDKATAEAQRIIDEATTRADELQKQAEKIIEDSRNEAASIITQSNQRADEIISKAADQAKARANAITQKALEDNYAASNEGLKEHMIEVTAQFLGIRDAMRDLEARFTQADLMKFFNAFHSLYDIIYENKYSLQTLPKEYSYICDNMDVFLDEICEGLASFGIITVISEPGVPFDVKLHTASVKSMFDPAMTAVKRSIRPAFVNRETGNVLKKEVVEIEQTIPE